MPVQQVFDEAFGKVGNDTLDGAVGVDTVVFGNVFYKFVEGYNFLHLGTGISLGCRVRFGGISHQVN